MRRRSTLRLSEEDIARGYALACQTVVDQRCHHLGAARGRAARARSSAATRPRRLRQRWSSATTTRHPGSRATTSTIEPPSMGDNTPDLERLQRELARQHGLRDVTPTLDGPGQAARGAPRRGVDRHRRGGAGRLDRPGQAPTGCWTCCPGEARQECSGSGHRHRDDDGRRLSGRPARPASSSTTPRPTTARSPAARTSSPASSTPGNPIIARSCRNGSSRPSTTLIDEMLARQDLAPGGHRAGDGGRQHHHDPPVPGPGAALHPAGAVHPGGRPLPAGAGRAGWVCTCTRRPSSTAFRPWEPTWAATSPPGCSAPGMHEEEPVTLFIDVGTNGEMVLGNSDWLISCACSAGPAFEGAGATSGMRAVAGAIEEVWIDPETPRADREHHRRRAAPRHLRVGHDLAPGRDDGHRGHRQERPHRRPTGRSPRVRRGENGLEYVVAWAAETGRRGDSGDIVLTETDIQNLLRAKAAIYAGAAVLCESVGLAITDVERVLIGGRVRPPHRRGEGHPDRPAARPALGALHLPGQHLHPGSLSGAHLPRAPRARWTSWPPR